MKTFGETFWRRVSLLANTTSNIFENRKAAIRNVIGVILVLGAEWFVEENIFSCPCTKELALNYGLTFIIGGAIIFWMIGLMIYSQIWKVCHGCCYLPREIKVYYTFCNSFLNACAKTTIVPLAWVFVILLDGDFVACMLSGELCMKEGEEYKKLKEKSQAYSLWSLVGILALAILVLCISRCSDKRNYSHYTFSVRYKRSEEEYFSKRLPEEADNLAKQNVDSFFQRGDMHEKLSSDALRENQVHVGYYSPLDKVVRNVENSESDSKSADTAITIVNQDTTSEHQDTTSEHQDITPVGQRLSRSF